MELGFSILPTAVVLFFVIDPFGNVPVLLSVLKDVETSRVRWVIAREMWWGLVILLCFLFLGGHFLKLFHLETGSVTIAGAIIFFIIGIRMVFPSGDGVNVYGSTGEPLLVPIAMPMIAGPSALATLLVISRSESASVYEILLSLLLAWAASSAILLAAPFLYRLLQEKGLQALERLMGMILLMMSVQMFVDGLRGLHL